MDRHALPRHALILAALATALVLAASPVAAISEVSQVGNHGQWLANDSQTAAGARCNYNDNYRLKSISARPPIVYSYRSKGQVVGWRLKIVHRYLLSGNDQYGEQTVYQSTYQKDFATLSNAADFTRKTWLRDIALTNSSRFKVWVIIHWYRPSDGAIEGSAKYRYDWFRQVAPGGLDNTQQIYYCYKSPY